MSEQERKGAAIKSLLALTAILILAWVVDRPFEVLTAALIIYALWHAINIVRLSRWLRQPESILPESHGIWSGIFSRIVSIKKLSTSQEKQFSTLLKDFQALADAFPDSTLLVDNKGRISWFNAAAKELFDLKQPGHTGKPVTDMILLEGFKDWFNAAGVNSQIELKLDSRGKRETWLELSSVQIRDEQRLVIFRDISELRDVERIRRDFVTNVSHELRTPLTVMLGYLELFLDQQPEDTGDAIQRMHAQAVQMQAMLDDFLELSRIQSLESDAEEECVDVPALLTQLKEQAEEISRGQHELKFDIQTGLNLSGITSDVESAFRNLIVNALKYTPEGGKVSVSWFDSQAGPTLEVSDTGIGIPKREIPRLTERFYRTSSDRGRKTGGTGLGLAIVKHVLNAHQAQLVIESEYGVGSKFSCIFPVERKRV